MTIPRSTTIAVLVCSLFAGTFISTAHADQISNGGFETPATAAFSEITAPDNVSIPSWNVTNGSVDVVNAAGNGFDVGAANDGAQYLDLNGSSAGTISQSFSTAAGATYLLTFAYANNYDPPNSLTAQVTVTDTSGPLLDTQITHSTSTAGNLDWTPFNQTFTASTTSATLTFNSLAQGDGGIFLDSVSVSQVPEPATLTSCLLLSLLPLARRRTPRN
jgi:choice-of-anchor C domain-containing protein